MHKVSHGPGAWDGLSIEALLLAPFPQIDIELQRACNELVPGNEPTPEGLREEAKRLCSLRGSELKDGKELAEAWSLLLSRAQAEALDRAGIPHPAIMIPITDEQRKFWYCFAARVEFLPEDDLENDVLVAVSEEWTAVATIGEALRAWLSLKASEERAQHPPPPGRSITICILGPSLSLEYERGLNDLHHKLQACLFGLEGPSISQPFLHLVFCGPDVPGEIHAQDWKDGRLHVEHWKCQWHDLQKENLRTVDLIVAMNAGTSVAPYRKLWLPTLMAIADLEDCLLWFTGYTLPEVAETQNDIKESCPNAVVLHCDAGRSSTLAGTDRVELGVTPCSYPGKANYSVYAAWLPGAGTCRTRRAKWNVGSILSPRLSFAAD